jgi:hypothetical protein
VTERTGGWGRDRNRDTGGGSGGGRGDSGSLHRSPHAPCEEASSCGVGGLLSVAGPPPGASAAGGATRNQGAIRLLSPISSSRASVTRRSRRRPSELPKRSPSQVITNNSGISPVAVIAGGG